MIEDRWADEEAWWTLGAAEARRRAHPSCVMALAQGLLQGEEIFAALDTTPRWQAVAMLERRVVEGEDAVVLAYRARAERQGEAPYEAICTSTWVRQQDGWRLIQHQQTAPAP